MADEEKSWWPVVIAVIILLVWIAGGAPSEYREQKRIRETLERIEQSKR